MGATLKTLLIYVPEMRYQRINPTVYLAKPSLMLLCSYLRHKGLEAEVLDLEAELGRPVDEEQRRSFFREARSLLAGREFDVAAISCFFSGVYLGAMDVAHLCRELKPESTIVMGGYHPTAVAEDFLGEGSPVDFVVRGEGEYFLASLARGEVARGGEPRLVDGKGMDLTEEFPLGWEGLLSPDMEPAYVNFPLSRGCPYQCDFCMEPTSMSSPRWRAYSVEHGLNLLGEIASTWKPKGVVFCDPLFGANKHWRRRFLEGMARRRFGQVFSFETRVDALEAEDLELIAELDMHVALGVETASEEMLRRMHKTKDPKDYLERLERILTYPTSRPLFFNINLLFNHPGETPDTLRETLSFFERLLPRTRHNIALVPNNFVFYPGNPLYTSIDEYRRLYGSKVAEMRWWTQVVDNQSELAKTIVASREMEEAFGGRVDYWREESVALRRRYRDLWDVRGKMMSIIWNMANQADYGRWERRVRERRAASVGAR